MAASAVEQTSLQVQRTALANDLVRFHPTSLRKGELVGPKLAVVNASLGEKRIDEGRRGGNRARRLPGSRVHSRRESCKDARMRRSLDDERL